MNCSNVGWPTMLCQECDSYGQWRCCAILFAGNLLYTTTPLSHFVICFYNLRFISNLFGMLSVQQFRGSLCLIVHLHRKKYIRNEKISSVSAKNKQHLKINIVDNVSRACKNVYRKYKLLCKLFWIPITCLLTSWQSSECIGYVHFQYIVAHKLCM